MTPNAQRILAALAGRGPRIDTGVSVNMSGADLASLAGALGSPSGAGGGSCGGGNASPFAGYAPAGRLTVVSTGPSSVERKSLSVTGSELPAGSIIVLDREKNGSHVVELASDSRPQPIGAGGVGFAIMNLDNQNAPGLYLAVRATRDLSIQVEFLAASVAGDEVVFQVLQPGGGSIAAAACAI
jgi:hypothetical protein